MSLVSQINDLATRIATEFKSVYSRQGSLEELTTTAKTSLVAAINEAATTGGGVEPLPTNLGMTRTATAVTVTSSTGNNAVVPAADTTNAGVMTNAMVTKLNGITAGATPTDAGTVAAAGAVMQNATDAGSWSFVLNESTMASNSATRLPTQQSVKTYVDNSVAALVNGSPAALDTLQELAAALGGDENYAATTTTALGNRLRFDAAQSLTAPQQAQGQTNLNVYSRTEIGDPETDFEAVFVAALA